MEPLRYHDFRLRGYSVTDFGTQIDLDLVRDNIDSSREESRITFSGVACYSFLNPITATLTEIEEVELASLVAEEAEFFVANAQQHGLRLWSGSLADYVGALQREKLHAWRVSSAVGFDGFVIARSVEGECATVPADVPDVSRPRSPLEPHIGGARCPNSAA